MTLRVLLKKLHGVAAQLGADTEVHISGLRVPTDILEVKPRRGYAVLFLAQDPSDENAKKRASYHQRVAQGLCSRCGEPMNGVDAVTCESCKLKRR